MSLRASCRAEDGVCLPNTLTDEVPKVTEALGVPFWHFWHLVTLGILKVTLLVQGT